jgi:hypothetical protein
MYRWWIVALAALGISGLDNARAQFPIGGIGSQAPPAVSPYLNLNRGGTQPGINYYGLVRPQLQMQQQLQNLQNQQTALATELGGGSVVPGQGVPMATTGHPVFFFDFARFFPLGGLPGNIGTGFGPGLPAAANPAIGGGLGRGGPAGGLGIGIVAPR